MHDYNVEKISESIKWDETCVIKMVLGVILNF